MSEVKKFGPYKGSEQNGGRPIYVYKKKGADGKWHTTSKNKARADYESKHGKLSKKKTWTIKTITTMMTAIVTYVH